MVGAEGFLQGGPIYDYDLEKHDQEATVVDVGGGCGSATIELCRRFPKIEAVLQEKLPIIEAAQSVFLGRKWARIQVRAAFIPHDFFCPQIKENIFVRFIIHDWVDQDCLQTLKPIRDIVPSKAEGS